MAEGNLVLGAPGELSAETSEDTVLDVAVGGDVADLLLRGLECLHAWVQLVVLEHAELADVANVSHGLKLVEVLLVVHEVQHEVVLHRDVKSLHLLGLSASFGHGAVDSVLRVHELVVFGSDAVNDVRSVDPGAVAIPVDVLAS